MKGSAVACSVPDTVASVDLTPRMSLRICRFRDGNVSVIISSRGGYCHTDGWLPRRGQDPPELDRQCDHFGQSSVPGVLVLQCSVSQSRLHRFQHQDVFEPLADGAGPHLTTRTGVYGKIVALRKAAVSVYEQRKRRLAASAAYITQPVESCTPFRVGGVDPVRVTLARETYAGPSFSRIHGRTSRGLWHDQATGLRFHRDGSQWDALCAGDSVYRVSIIPSGRGR